MKRTILNLICLTVFSNFMCAQPFATVQNIDPNTGDEPYEFASGDLDGDGDIDLVMATYFYNGGTPATDNIKWYKNDGSGNFTIETTVSSTVQWVDGLTVADVDGQYGLDIIATSSNEGLTYYLSNAAGGFDSAVTIDATLVGPGQVVAGDINLDGNMDIATIAFNENKTAWYSGDGTGNFTAQPDIENGTGNGTLYVDLADFDGDSDLDAVVTYFNTQSIEIYYNQYIESGSTVVSWIKDTVTVDSGNSYLFDVEFADVNNDGVMDVIAVDNVSGVVEWFSKIKNGASTANAISDDSIIDRPAVVVVADINNDGLNDVILTDGGASDDAIIFFEGASSASPSTTPTLIADNNFQMYDFTVDDYDADGDMDIASLGYFSDTVFWYENEMVTLGTSEFDTESLIIHPNPATNQLTFSGNFNETLEIAVFNALGQTVLFNKISAGNQLDISELSTGIYVIKDMNSDLTRKFIKQ